MKKILLGTTALIAMGMVSSQAVAADKISLSLGGFMKQYVAVTDGDATTTAATPNAENDLISTYGNTEVYFSGKTTLDNGLTVGVMVQLEADSADVTSKNADVSALTISSDSMGQLLIGADTGAADKLMNVAPKVGPEDISGINGYAATNGIGDIETRTSESKANKLRYISPTFGGVTVAVSHAPSSTNNDKIVAGGSASRTQAILAYSGEFSGVGVNFDIAREQIQQVTEQTRAGLVLAMGGFSVGGSYAAFNDNDEGNISSSVSNDGNVWDLGVGYATGPYKFAVTYSDAEVDNTSADADQDTATTWSVGGSYDMGAGVNLVGQYMKGKYQNELGTLTTTNNPSVFIAGVEVSF